MVWAKSNSLEGRDIDPVPLWCHRLRAIVLIAHLHWGSHKRESNSGLQLWLWQKSTQKWHHDILSKGQNARQVLWPNSWSRFEISLFVLLQRHWVQYWCWSLFQKNFLETQNQLPYNILQNHKSEFEKNWPIWTALGLSRWKVWS